MKTVDLFEKTFDALKSDQLKMLEKEYADLMKRKNKLLAFEHRRLEQVKKRLGK